MTQADNDYSALGNDVKALEASLAKSQADLTAANLKLTAANLNVDSLTGTVNAQAAKLLAMPAIGQTTDGKGTAHATVLPDNSLIFGGKYIGSIFKSAQKYAVTTGNRNTLIDVSATSDSGGIDLRGNGTVLIRPITNGCGQNGLSAGLATNFAILYPVSHGNNAGNYDAYYEGGGGKLMTCSDGTIDDGDYAGNLGVALWFDGSCRRIKVNRGNYSNSTVSGANAGKQVANVRVEISSYISMDGITSLCATGQHTAVQFHASGYSSLFNSSIVGQVGLSGDARQTTNNITIAGNKINGSVWWTVACPGLVLDGNTYTGTASTIVAYAMGKPLTFAGLQGLGFEKNGKLISA